MKALYSDNELNDLFDRIKKFIRKIRKSSALKDEFEKIQELLDIDQVVLIKDMEVKIVYSY